MITVGSLFSGVGGFELGFDLAGCQIVWQCEYDPQAQCVLRRHFPKVDLYDDVRQLDPSKLVRPDVLIGGFPCQDISVAGRREGLAGERSGLWWEFHRIINGLKPQWIVIENVPGLLSSNNGRDMGAITGALAECGYWWAYRVLDSQYFGVPQRRRRVFIVASLTKGSPQSVLFERESSPWDTPPSRKAGEGFAAVAGTLSANAGGVNRPAGNGNELDFCVPVGHRMTAFGEYVDDGTSSTLKQRDYKDATDLVIGFSPQAGGNTGLNINKNLSGTLQESQIMGVAMTCLTPWDHESKRIHSDNGIAPTIAGSDGKGGQRMPYIAPTLSAKNEVASSSTQRDKWYEQAAEMFGAVRRLTPIECERLQGFEDNYTAWGIDEQGRRVEMKDTPRYRMLGNAVTVNVSEWIAKRLVKADKELQNDN